MTVGQAAGTAALSVKSGAVLGHVNIGALQYSAGKQEAPPPNRAWHALSVFDREELTDAKSG
jgi:hypothetical protein